MAMASILTMFFLVTACGDSGAGNGGTVVATVTPAVEETPAGPTPIPEPPRNSDGQLTGFTYPIAGGCLPEGPQLMPNAPREYRDGTHEGVDFYDSDNCTPVPPETPVLSAYGGVIIRIDHDYEELTFETLQRLEADPTTDEALDTFRGRQVWIDHGGGIVTRYCHLNNLAQGLQVGDYVEQGTLLGGVGESGTPESVTAPGAQIHLHFEVRTGDTFLGEGMTPVQVRAEYEALFAD